MYWRHSENVSVSVGTLNLYSNDSVSVTVRRGTVTEPYRPWISSQKPREGEGIAVYRLDRETAGLIQAEANPRP